MASNQDIDLGMLMEYPILEDVLRSLPYKVRTATGVRQGLQLHVRRCLKQLFYSDAQVGLPEIPTPAQRRYRITTHLLRRVNPIIMELVSKYLLQTAEALSLPMRKFYDSEQIDRIWAGGQP